MCASPQTANETIVYKSLAPRTRQNAFPQAHYGPSRPHFAE
jgi:hypothetical protein